jgi:hypothetical protein
MLLQKQTPVNEELLLQQTKVESQVLEHVSRALESALGWVVEGKDFSRKLSSVRFITELYQRHLERLFALEEIDGYMENVGDLNPELTSQVDNLKQEHEQFRAAVRKIVVRLDSSLNRPDFDSTCAKLRQTINQVLEHLRRENELLFVSVQRDIGGEG